MKIVFCDSSLQNYLFEERDNIAIPRVGDRVQVFGFYPAPIVKEVIWFFGEFRKQKIVQARGKEIVDVMIIL